MPRRDPILNVEGDRFLLDGDPVDLWGIRTASATASDDQTDHLIDQLDEYAAHGVNAVTVFYSGCSGAYYDPFSADGNELVGGHRERMNRIIEACAERDMVVIVGLFYQRVEYDLEDAAAVRQAVRTATQAVAPYGNVIINIANEHTSHYWRRFAETFDLRNPDRLLELIAEVTVADPGRLVGGGGYHPETCAVIGRDDRSDVLMFDTGRESLTNFDSGEMYDRLVQAGVTGKPIVNVETFGGYTGEFPRGVFPQDLRATYEAEVERAAARPGLSLFFHNNRWCQTPDLPMRYDLGGAGTPADPGMRWYFEHVEAVRRRHRPDADER